MIMLTELYSMFASSQWVEHDDTMVLVLEDLNRALNLEVVF